VRAAPRAGGLPPALHVFPAPTRARGREDLTLDRLEQLWAVHEIRQLAYKYAYAADCLDFERLASLFVETEVPVEFPGLDIHVMRKAEAFMSQVGVSTMFVANHLIEFDGPDRAHGSVYGLAFIDNRVFCEQAIIYQDVYQRSGDRWLFLKRDHLLWWGREAVNPMHQPPADWPQSQVGAGLASKVLQGG
jgi:hypothetical protein